MWGNIWAWFTLFLMIYGAISLVSSIIVWGVLMSSRRRTREHPFSYWEGCDVVHTAPLADVLEPAISGIRSGARELGEKERKEVV